MQLSGNQIQGLIPGGRHQNSFLSDEGDGEPVGAVHKSQAEPALDAELAGVGQGIPLSPHPDGAVFQHPNLHLAAHSAVGADGGDGLLRPLPSLKSGVKGAGGADIDAGSAEPAVGVLEALRANPVHAMKVGVAKEHPLSPHLLADPYASTAEDAEVVVPVEKRLPEDGHVPVGYIIADFFQAHKLHCLLQLAFAVLGAVLASHSHRELSHALPQVPAFVLSLAEEAAGGMVGQSQEHLQGMPPHLLKLIGAGLHHHAFLGRGVAGCGIAVHALYRYYAQLTGAYGFEVRMVAESRDIYPCFASRIHDGGSLGNLYRQTIDLELNRRHANRACLGWGLIVLEGCSGIGLMQSLRQPDNARSPEIQNLANAASRAIKHPPSRNENPFGC